MDRQMVFNVQLLLQWGGGGQNYFLKFLVVTKQVYNYVKISPKSNFMHYNMYSHVCEKDSSKFQSYRKGT